LYVASIYLASHQLTASCFNEVLYCVMCRHVDYIAECLRSISL